MEDFAKRAIYKGLGRSMNKYNPLISFELVLSDLFRCCVKYN